MLNDDNKLLISGDTVGETFHGLEGRNIRVVVGVPIIEQPGAETSRNERIRDEDLNNYWNAIKVLDEKDLFLKLSNVNILGEQDGTSTLFIRKCYQDLSTVVLNDAIRRIRITGNPGIGKTFVLENADDIVQQQKLMSAVDLCGDKIFDYIGGHDANPEISHTIIHLWTNLPTEEKEKNTDENANNAIEYIEEVPYTKQLYYFASDYVANLVTEKFKQNIMGRLLRDIEGSLLTGTSDQFLGCCFEQIAHRMLREGGNFIARSLEPAFRENEVLHQQFTKQENILTFSKIEDIEESKYYQPEIKNFPSIDAIVAPKVLLQMTTSMTHPIKMVGLDKLYDGNKLAKNEDISFYFVVPAQLYDHYQKQGFVTTKEANVRRFSPWIPQYVKQYALRIDLSGTNIPTGMPPTAGGPGSSADESSAGNPSAEGSSTKRPSEPASTPSSSTPSPKKKRGRPRKK
ncbi:unnamed protein product [Rhizophagus irregularis]|nr:unnamed protein product [Rhizophagus irregularis]